MTVIVFYPSNESKAFRNDLPKLSVPSFALCWHEKQRAISANPLDTISLYCGISKLSFKHLSGPIIFAEENIKIDEAFIVKLSDSTEPLILASSRNQSLDFSQHSPLTIHGLCIPEIPEDLETSSYENFKTWLEKRSGELPNIKVLEITITDN